jgi:hypothetical protein
MLGYAQVISEHRKAKALVQGILQPRAKSDVWHNLFIEVEKGVESMVAALATLLKDSRTPPSEAADAIKHVLQLAVDGAASAAALNPVALWVEAQVRRFKSCAPYTTLATQEFIPHVLKQMLMCHQACAAFGCGWQCHGSCARPSRSLGGSAGAQVRVLSTSSDPGNTQHFLLTF